MFTSIEKLRNSSAVPSRVTSVETYLRKNYGQGPWDPKIVFPVAVVLVSNTRDDYEWVLAQRTLQAIAYNGVDPKNFGAEPAFATKADAETYIQGLLVQSARDGIPLMQMPGANVVNPPEEQEPTLPVTPSKAPARPGMVRRVVAAITDKQPSVTSIAGLRTRAQIGEALQAFTENKIVASLVPVNKAVAKAADIDVPKGKQAYIIVY